MNSRQFFDYVVKMRIAQRDYFRSNGRDKDALVRSKDYERIIDAEIKRVQLITKESMSPRLDFNQ